MPCPKVWEALPAFALAAEALARKRQKATGARPLP